MALKTMLIVYQSRNSGNDNHCDWGRVAFGYCGKAFYAPDGRPELERGYDLLDLSLVLVADDVPKPNMEVLETKLKESGYKGIIMDVSTLKPFKYPEILKAFLRP